jgi:hypothetical protein
MIIDKLNIDSSWAYYKIKIAYSPCKDIGAYVGICMQIFSWVYIYYAIKTARLAMFRRSSSDLNAYPLHFTVFYKFYIARIHAIWFKYEQI